jgi:putative tricarboxylic transport membrane protein
MSKQDDEPRPAARVRNPQDFWGGIAIVALAGFAFYASYDLPGMQDFSFGPGTAPRLFASLLGALGIGVSLSALVGDGPRFPRYAVRGPLLLTAAILLFAALIQPLGLVITSFLVFMVAASGSSETRWVETTIASVVMTTFCVVLFMYLLNLPFQLWPRFTAFGVEVEF